MIVKPSPPPPPAGRRDQRGPEEPGTFPRSRRLEDDLFVVYSMSNSPYQAWQAELLDFSARACAQPGRIVRLCSPDSADPERAVPIFDGGTTLWTPRFSRIGRGPVARFARGLKRRLGMPMVGRFDFPCLNKPFGMRWFLESEDLDDDVRLLWLDPDMIFHRPWVPDMRGPRPGVCGQRWWGYDDRWFRGALSERERARLPGPEDAVMFPFCLRVGEMRRILDSFCELTVRIYRETRDWKSEMAALVVSLGIEGIPIRTITNIAPCSNWSRELAEDPEAPLAHYTQPMIDDRGRTVWNKRDYTPSTARRPWRRPPHPHRTARLCDRRTLELLHRFIDEQEQATAACPQGSSPHPVAAASRRARGGKP